MNGCATTPSTNLAYIQWIGIDDAIYTYPQGFGALVTELSHELGHNLGLLHTYAPTCCPESCTTTSTDFLSDVFGSGSVDCPEVCSQDYGWSCDIYSSSNSCSNNLMGGTNTSGYLSPLQLGRIHRETQLKSLRKYVSCELGSIDWKITTDEVWDFDIKMYDNIIVNPGASLTASCNITLPCNGKIDIKPGGRLILSDNSSITMATGSFIHVEEGATLEINNTVSGKGIIFDQSGTNYVKVEGTLQFGANADFTIQGIGYYHFLGSPTLILGSGSDVNLIGANNNTKMLDIETQLTIDGHNVTLKTGKIEVHNDDWLSIKNASVDIDDIKIDGVDALPSNNKGLYIESPVTLCSIHNSTFTDLALGIELNYVGQNPGADIFTNTFTNCKVPVKSHSSNNIGITLCTMSESITTGSIGILIQGGYGITVSNTLVQQFETGAQLSLCKGFYLTSASKIYDTHTGISGANSEIFIRNGAKVELTLTAGVNLTGTYTTSPYPHYTSMLTMDDQGCGNIVDCYGDCITGSNFILNIDPIIHDGNDGDNNPSYNPNWISRATGQAGKYFNICYNQIGNPSHAPTLIYARKNFWVPYSTTNVAPTSSNVFIGSTTGSSCFNSNVARTYTPMTQCATPSTYDCMYCVGTLKGEEEEDDNGNEVSAASIVMASYESANEEFLVEDAPDTRAQFDDVSALELNYDSLTNQWSVTTLAGVTLPTDDSTVLRIMAAKVLYDDGDSTEEKLTAGLQSAQDIFAPYYFELLNNPATLTLNNQLLIYPNPATNKVVVEIKNSNNAAELKLMITDVFGKILQTENINHENLKTTINTSAFTSGIYFFKLLSGNQQFDIKKLVVVK